jgi:hypothetical protein
MCNFSNETYNTPKATVLGVAEVVPKSLVNYINTERSTRESANEYKNDVVGEKLFTKTEDSLFWNKGKYSSQAYSNTHMFFTTNRLIILRALILLSTRY